MVSQRECKREIAVLMLMLLCSKSACTMAASSTEEETSGAVGKYNANHAPVVSPRVQSELHQNVVRALRAAKYSTFAALLDNLTDSVVRQGITIFAPNDAALSDFFERTTEERPRERLLDVVRLHIITVAMPFSNLLRLEPGSRLKTDASNHTIQVTNTTAGDYKVDDAVIVDPDLYTDPTIAVHGINAVFNTSEMVEGEPDTEEPENSRRHHHGDDPDDQDAPPPTSSAFKIPLKFKRVPVTQFFMSIVVLFFL